DMGSIVGESGVSARNGGWARTGRGPVTRICAQEATMKAIVKTRAEEGLELIDVPTPTVGPNQVLIKVSRTGICGTDVHIQKWDGWARKTVKTPRVIG